MSRIWEGGTPPGMELNNYTTNDVNYTQRLYNNPPVEPAKPEPEPITEPEDITIDRSYFKLPEDNDQESDSQDDNAENEQNSEESLDNFEWDLNDGKENNQWDFDQLNKPKSAEEISAEMQVEETNLIESEDEGNIETEGDEAEGQGRNKAGDDEVKEVQSERINVLRKLRNLF